MKTAHMTAHKVVRVSHHNHEAHGVEHACVYDKEQQSCQCSCWTPGEAIEFIDQTHGGGLIEGASSNRHGTIAGHKYFAGTRVMRVHSNEHVACKTFAFPRLMDPNYGYVRTISSVSLLARQQSSAPPLSRDLHHSTWAEESTSASKVLNTESFTSWIQKTSGKSATVCVQSTSPIPTESYGLSSRISRVSFLAWQDNKEQSPWRGVIADTVAIALKTRSSTGSEQASCKRVVFSRNLVTNSAKEGQAPIILGGVDLHELVQGGSAGVSYWVREASSSGCTVCVKGRQSAPRKTNRKGVALYETPVFFNWLAFKRGEFTPLKDYGVFSDTGVAKQGAWSVMAVGSYRACAEVRFSEKMVFDLADAVGDPQILALPVMMSRDHQARELIESTYLSQVATTGFTVCSMLRSSVVPTAELHFNWALLNDNF
jgi:hypothetical protein